MRTRPQRIAVVGAGVSGSVLAHELAASGRFQVVVFESNATAGGVHETRRDPETGILHHLHGPTVFCTDDKETWNYVNQFARFGNLAIKASAVTGRGIYPMPINLRTLSQFFGRKLSPTQASCLLESLGNSSIYAPRNFEEQALHVLGQELYDTFLYGYVKKHWCVEPRELPASFLRNLPVRLNQEENFYPHRYQGIPVEGYTPLLLTLLRHRNIQSNFNTRFYKSMTSDFDHVFYTGGFDAYFDYVLGRLRYRTLHFETLRSSGTAQATAVQYFCQPTVPYTRVVEHKLFAPWEAHSRTLCSTEYPHLSQPGETPHCPMRLAADKNLLRGYRTLAQEARGITFAGRLGTYRYLDVQKAVREARELATVCQREWDSRRWPLFSGEPLQLPTLDRLSRADRQSAFTFAAIPRAPFPAEAVPIQRAV